MKKKPQQKGTVKKVYTTTPKKPNSANRKVAKVELSNFCTAISGLKGFNHNLKKFAKVWIFGKRFRDTPGVKTSVLPGKEGFLIQAYKTKRRSVYGLKKKLV